MTTHAGYVLALHFRKGKVGGAMGYNVRNHIGTRTTVRHVYGAYRLPDGLNEGDEVTLVDFQPGYWHVERNGQRFRVAMSGVGDAGRLPALRPRAVHPGCKPRVRTQGPVDGF